MDNGGKATASIRANEHHMELNSNSTAFNYNPDSYTWYKTSARFFQRISGKMENNIILVAENVHENEE